MKLLYFLHRWSNMAIKIIIFRHNLDLTVYTEQKPIGYVGNVANDKFIDRSLIRLLFLYFYILSCDCDINQLNV